MPKAIRKKRSLPTRFKEKTTIFIKKPIRFVDRRPMASFFASLLLILGLIVLVNVLNRQKPQAVEEKAPAKAVSVYKIGSAPKITASAQVEKSGVIQVVALTNGIVQDVKVKEGDRVKQGDVLVSMSSNYQGGNSFVLQRQIAQTQFTTASVALEKQKEIIKKQKELAKQSDTNSDELRKITNDSISETQDSISLNETILKTLDTQIAAAPDAQTALPFQQQKSQYLSATNQAKSQLRNAQYTASSDNAPAKMSDLQKDITLKQLDLQEKTLVLSREIAGLQVSLARVNEQLMFPSAPFNGVLQRVFVRAGQSVTPGTPLLVLSQVAEDDPITAVAFVSKDVAKKVSFIQSSTLYIDGTAYPVFPSFVSDEAVQGSLYAIYYPIPQNYNHSLTDKGFIKVDIPIGNPDTSMIATYIPLDSVYQTRDKAYVFVESKGIAVSKTVVLGQVYGRFVEVISGLTSGDKVIVDRTVIQGDEVQVQ